MRTSSGPNFPDAIGAVVAIPKGETLITAGDIIGWNTQAVHAARNALQPGEHCLIVYVTNASLQQLLTTSRQAWSDGNAQAVRSLTVHGRDYHEKLLEQDVDGPAVHILAGDYSQLLTHAGSVLQAAWASVISIITRTPLGRLASPIQRMSSPTRCTEQYAKLLQSVCALEIDDQMVNRTTLEKLLPNVH